MYVRDVDAGSFLDETTCARQWPEDAEKTSDLPDDARRGKQLAKNMFRVLTLMNRADTQRNNPTDSFSDNRLALPRIDAASTGN